MVARGTGRVVWVGWVLATAAAAQEPAVVVYGRLKPTIIVGQATESYGQQSFVATTAAAHPRFVEEGAAARLSFQAAQSRLGLRLAAPEAAVRGQLEVDFVQFNLASAVQGSLPRLRIAEVSWQLAPAHRLQIGQGWDLFSPLNSHSFDWVGGSFQAGNAGFLRQQLAWHSQIGGLALAAAVGMQAANHLPEMGDLERGLWPSLAARAAYRGAGGQVGVSLIGSRLRFGDARQGFAGGVNLFGEARLAGGRLELRAEGYGGQSLNNLALFTLAQSHVGGDVRELGGYGSARLALGAAQGLHLVAGGARILNPDALLEGFDPAAEAPRRVAARGPGIAQNLNLRLGYSLAPAEALTLTVEPYLLRTRHQGVGGALEAQALGIQLGAAFEF